MNFLNHQEFPRFVLDHPWLMSFYFFVNKISVLRNKYAYRALYRVLDRVKTPRKVLDLGSGFGTFIFPVRKYTSQDTIVGIDISPSNIEISERLKQRHAELTTSFIEGSFLDVEFPKDQNIILCIAVLHMLPDPLILLNKIKQALAKGGTAIIYVAVNHRRYLSAYKKLFTVPHFVYDDTFKTINTLTTSKVEQLLEDAGLQVIEKEFSFGAPAAILYELIAILEWYIKSLHPLLLIPSILGLLILYPFQLLVLEFDLYTQHSTGNGMLLTVTHAE